MRGPVSPGPARVYTIPGPGLPIPGPVLPAPGPSLAGDVTCAALFYPYSGLAPGPSLGLLTCCVAKDVLTIFGPPSLGPACAEGAGAACCVARP